MGTEIGVPRQSLTTAFRSRIGRRTDCCKWSYVNSLWMALSKWVPLRVFHPEISGVISPYIWLGILYSGIFHGLESHGDSSPFALEYFWNLFSKHWRSKAKLLTGFRLWGPLCEYFGCRFNHCGSWCIFDFDDPSVSYGTLDRRFGQRWKCGLVDV